MIPEKEPGGRPKEEHGFKSADPEERNKEKEDHFSEVTEDQIKKRQSLLPTTEKVETPSRIPSQIIRKFWGDPVISKLIATIIIYFSPFLLTFLIQLVKEWNFLDSVRKVLQYSLPAWMYLVIIAFVFLSFLLYKIVKMRFFRNPSQGFPFEDTIGNFKFGELFNSLLDMPVMQEHSFLPKSHNSPQNLLQAFLAYLPLYNMEVDINHRDSSTLFFRVGPQLISYGLLEYVISKDIVANKNEWVIRPTKDGYKFYAYLEKYKLYVDYMEKATAKKIKKSKPEDKEKKP